MSGNPQRLIRAEDKRSQIHYERWLRQQCGATLEEIAAVDKVTVESVRTSIIRYEMHKQARSLESTNTAVGGTVIAVMPTVTDMLKRGLTAKKKRKAANNKIVAEHDMATQLKAGEVVRGFVESIQPKSGSKVDINNQVNSQTNISTRGFNEATYQPGFEERIVTIRAKVNQQNLLPREVGTPDDPDAEIEEDDEETAVAPSASSEA